MKVHVLRQPQKLQMGNDGWNRGQSFLMTPRCLVLLSLMIMSLVMSRFAHAQAPGSSSTLSSTPVVTAGFSEPDRPLDWRLYQTPDACVSAFERLLKTTTFNTQAEKNVARDTQSGKSDDWTPISSGALAAGKQCLDQLRVTDVQTFELPILLRLAIAVNTDSLVQAIVARQLAVAGPSDSSRARVLDAVIDNLMTNGWVDFDQTIDHLTKAHVALARRYATQIDSMDGQTTLKYRLRALTFLNKGLQLGDSDVTAKLAHVEQQIQRLRQVPLNTVPAGDRKQIRMMMLGAEMYFKSLTYMQTLSHADLTQVVALRDSVHRVIGIPSPDSLLGTPAASIPCDYRFNASDVPAHASRVTIPASGVVSLLVFVNPDKITHIEFREFAELRRQHELFPALEITLITMTQGTFQGRDLLTNPDQEATLIHSYLTDSLGVPGNVCVVKSQYRTVIGGQAIPLASPVLNGYKLDPRTYGGRAFLVDPLGWIVGEAITSQEELIRRLLSQIAAHPQ